MENSATESKESAKKFTMDQIVAPARGAVCLPRQRDLRRSRELLGLRPSGRGIQKQHQARMVAQVRAGIALNVGMDAAILMNPETWVASGHVGGFSDPLMDCKACKARFRADKLIEDYAAEHGLTDIRPDGWTNAQMEAYIREQGIVCPDCGKAEFTGIRKFNLMFKTFQGVTEDTASELYLRPETAQGIFVNFKNVLRTTRRNCRSALRRSANPSATRLRRATSSSASASSNRWSWILLRAGHRFEWYHYWKDYCHKFLLSLGMQDEKIRLREHAKEELSHYSKGTTDIEFLFPFAGANSGALPTARTLTSRATPRTAARALNTLTRSRTKNSSPTASSRPGRGSCCACFPLQRVRRAGAGRRGRPHRSAPPPRSRRISAPCYR
jgi:hypothetical protein